MFTAFLISLGITVCFFFNSSPLQARSPTPPTRSDVCAIVTTMPDAEKTDQFLSALDSSRSQVMTDLIALKKNMEQYDAEGYGWHNMIDASSTLNLELG